LLYCLSNLLGSLPHLLSTLRGFGSGLFRALLDGTAHVLGTLFGCVADLLANIFCFANSRRESVTRGVHRLFNPALVLDFDLGAVSASDDLCVDCGIGTSFPLDRDQ